MSIAQSEVQCISCGANRARALFRGLVSCTRCGLVYFPRRLTAVEAEALYDESYFRGAEYLDYLADRPVHEANFRRRLTQLARWLPAGRRLFEVGCSYGLFLNLARQHWDVAGCDIAAVPCRYAREELGLDVHCADLLDVPLRTADVDAFCLWDTIEHLGDPELYLERIAEVVRPGGLLALTTGDIGSRLARHQGPSWRQIHPPTHLWYFSLQTIRSTLARFGFEVTWHRHIGISRSVSQIVYSLTSLGRERPAPFYNACVRTGLGRLRIWTNTLDLMMIVARRA